MKVGYRKLLTRHWVVICFGFCAPGWVDQGTVPWKEALDLLVVLVHIFGIFQTPPRLLKIEANHWKSFQTLLFILFLPLGFKPGIAHIKSDFETVQSIVKQNWLLYQHHELSKLFCYVSIVINYGFQTFSWKCQGI